MRFDKKERMKKKKEIREEERQTYFLKLFFPHQNSLFGGKVGDFDCGPSSSRYPSTNFPVLDGVHTNFALLIVGGTVGDNVPLA